MKIKGFLFIVIIFIIFGCNSSKVLKSSIELICVEPGTFMMGSNDGDEDEKPVHKVTITRLYYIGKYKVTNDEAARVFTWALQKKRVYIKNYHIRLLGNKEYVLVRLAESNPAVKITYKDNKIIPLEGKEKHPCIGMNWFGAVVFCNFLSEMEGREPVYDMEKWTTHFKKNGYRLPTEAEWEFAARGGVKSKGFKYAGSNNIDEVAWYGMFDTQPVGLKKPNELGLYDMCGNLYEWCNDPYGEDYYKNSQIKDPKGPEPREDYINDYKVRRSCVWNQKPYNNRVTNRIYGWIFCTSICGFRVVIK